MRSGTPSVAMSLPSTSAATLETKLKALACHRSQTAGVRYDEAVRGLARWRGVMSLSGGDAEVFEVIKASQNTVLEFYVIPF